MDISGPRALRGVFAVGTVLASLWTSAARTSPPEAGGGAPPAFPLISREYLRRPRVSGSASPRAF